MITLFGSGRLFGLVDASPFVGKADLLLRMSGLPYQFRRGDPRKAPKGKIPYIDDDGVSVSDSAFIRWHLESKHGADFSGGYSPAERATGLAFERLCEDHLYWGLVHMRWADDANFDRGPRQFFNAAPALIRPLIIYIVRRKKLASALYHQGFGRHSLDELLRLIEADLDALSAFIGDKPYLLGDRPCGSDATIFAFVDALMSKTFISPIRDAAEARPTLVAYCQRMRAQYYPEGL